ncbi:MAG: hypothetical protein M3Y27_17525 [Acidobacteriota bacterium]|nr:hypothetical protein [Acidobacteriota bacterium]
MIGPLQVENPARLAGARKRHGVKEDFASDRFIFLPERNGYRCPEQKFIPYYRIQNAPQGTLYEYKAKTGTCDGCVSKPHCCPQTESRMIRRVRERPEIGEFRSKMAQPEKREIYKQRSQVAEFVQGAGHRSGDQAARRAAQ